MRALHLRRARGSHPSSPFARLPPLVGDEVPDRGDDSPTVAVLVYDGVTSYEVESCVRHLTARTRARAVFVADARRSYQGIEPVRDVVAAARLADLERAEIVVVPGGVGWRRLADDEEVLSWLRTACTGALGVVALSTGPLLLAAAGLLDGVEAACHWLATADLEKLGARPAARRVAASLDDRLVTASGALSAEAACGLLVDRLEWGR